jgi:hypothetical protein
MGPVLKVALLTLAVFVAVEVIELLVDAFAEAYGLSLYAHDVVPAALAALTLLASCC